MTEYVYALHDFVPEHDDEIAFNAGERIEVVEKDEQYGDGWWQGRNLAGKLGLFPQGYTSASAPLPDVRTPTVASSLQPLQEEAPEDIASLSSDGAVMAATLTDVQEAIEQLGVRGDHETARSFSFASTRDGETDRETETEDEAEVEADGQGWHKVARKALAERAKKENARKEEEQAEMNGHTSPQRQSPAPPIPVELSDESDDEADEEALHRGQRDIHHHHHHKYNGSTSTARPISLNDSPPPEPLKPPISLDNVPGPSSPSPPPQEVTVVATPALRQPIPHTPTTATNARFPQPPAPPVPQAEVTSTVQFPMSTPSTLAANVPLPGSPSPSNGPTVVTHSPLSIPPSIDPVTPSQPPVPMPAMPAPGPLSVPASSSVPAPAFLPAPSSLPMSSSAPLGSVRESLKHTHPSEWTVGQVVEWLRTKNVDEATCAKFIEHEITGDVLLELDVSLLKELDIMAFGKRMRISNAIVELRRPASFSSEQQAHSSGFTSPPAGVLSAESSPHTGDLPVSPYSHRQEASGTTTSGDPNLTTSGFSGLSPAAKNRPAQLALSSPSDGSLQPKAPSAVLMPEEGDDGGQDARGVQSETEIPPGLGSATRRGFLGRSTESGSSREKDKDNASRNSKESPLPSPLSDEMGVRHHARGKRSLDGSAKGTGDRLSFFGSTLGKARKPETRKPAPRYSLYESDTSPPQAMTERSSRSITRLYLGHGKKNTRPTTPVKNGKEEYVVDLKNEKNDDAAPRDPAVLRKRHPSATGSTLPPYDNNLSDRVMATQGEKLHPGESVLDQIGHPDHAGWLRKKGERYNTWKLRYMVLKGPHLYYLRSDSRTETKIKGYIKVQGYKVIADENANPGKYGFRIVHDTEPSHFFSSEEQTVVREWMKALMKATIDRDFSKPVVSSCNIPTIPLTVAQAMSPTPRPPSPTARAATQRALRRENPNQLSSRDARVLMGLPAPENGVPPTNDERAKLETYFGSQIQPGESPTSQMPPRPTRGTSRTNRTEHSYEHELLDWANSVLPKPYRINDISTDLASGIILLRLAESISGKPSDPPVLDSAFTTENNLEGMFKLFDFLLDHDVKMGSVSINDIKQGRLDKTIQLLKSLKAWSERRESLVRSPGRGVGQTGPWMETGPGKR